MGRGRRPNMALEPTRALQTQRAFRQRKAEHLANLEESVKLLEDENDKLRKLLHMDPATNRSLKSPNASSLSRSSSPSIASTSRHHDTAGPVPIAPARTPGQMHSSPSVKPTLVHQQTGSGIPTPGSSDSTATCEHCAPIQQANRQLAVAAAQVETQMAHLQQSIKALRSVLQHHNIPIPPTPSADLVASSSSPREHDDAHRHAKRSRVGGPHNPADHATSASATPAGIHMTSHFFSASSPAAAYEMSRRPPTLPNMTANANSSQAWHTPSPSAILSAPTPPSASFSPRPLANHNSASYAQSPAASSSAMANDDAHYKARHVGGRQNSISNGNASQRSTAPPPLPPASSPARQAAHLPPWSASGSLNQRQHASGSFAYNSSSNALGDYERVRGNSYPSNNSVNPHRRQHEEYSASSASTSEQHRYSLPMEFPPLPPSASGRSPSFSGAGASPSYSQHFASYETTHSPRNGMGSGSRLGQSPRERMDELAPNTSIYARPSFSAHTSSSSSQSAPSQQSSAPYQRPSADSSAEKVVGEPAKKSCAPTNGNGSKCCPPPKLASVDSTAQRSSCGPSTSKCCPPKQQDVAAVDKEEKEGEGKRWASPPPLGVSFDMRGSAKATGDEAGGGGAGNDEECCFGLVNCDAQGRIII